MNTLARRMASCSLALTLAAIPLVAAASTSSPAEPQSSTTPLMLAPTHDEAPSSVLLAANDGGGSGSLSDFEKAQDTSGYNSEYIFALTRGLANSTMHPAGKVPLFIFTLPLDVVFLPFAAIAGLFG